MFHSKKLIIFDLDGVLFDSKNNMESAWKEVKKKHGIKTNFKNYFQYIGLPFKKILSNLGIKKDFDLISQTYKKESIKNINKVKLQSNVKKVLFDLRKRYKFAIVTSKDKTRTKILLKKFKLNFTIVVSPSKNLKGKPYPDQILKALKLSKTRIKKKAVYVGDTKVDYKTAKNAQIYYINASYGYGRKDFTCKHKIKKFRNLPRALKQLNF